MAVSSLYLLFFVIVNVAVPGASRDNKYCEKSSQCGRENIRFPFRLKDSQPNYCGYPGFDLSCNSSQTVLELPFSPIKLHVAEIAYETQKILVYIPYFISDGHQTKPSLELLNLSTSPFRSTNGFSSLSLLSCSVPPTCNYSNYRLPCSTSGGWRSSSIICAIDSNSHVDEYSEIVNCTKMYEFTAPVSYTRDIKNFRLIPPDKNFRRVSLSWSEVPRCKKCESMKQRCRLKKEGVENETECFGTIPGGSQGWNTPLVIPVSTVGPSALLLLVFIILIVYTLAKIEREYKTRIQKFLEDYISNKPSRYAYEDIKKITSQFNQKLGQGAYGTVFKGKLSNEILVAVKILNNSKGKGEEFINEVATMGRIHHVNVVRLVGYCADGFRRALVYEFLPNDSLAKYILPAGNAANHSLSWETFQNIALGIAKGIEYLHQGCDQRILHFDIKPQNILLDQNFNPKISDFGLAKFCSKDQSVVSMTTARGTVGYIAPEVFSRNFGNVSHKADVYSYGMLLLEMVGGKQNTCVTKQSEDTIYYPEWIYNLLQRGEDHRIFIEDEGDAKIIKKLATIGLWCIQWYPICRPTMKAVVQMFERKEELSMPPNPFASAAGPSKTNTKMYPLKP